jgi:cellobiose transport system substrate-binding protein
MTGVVEGNSGEQNAGNWDFTSAPGVAGNWGGAWLGVTANSAHPEEAAMLVDFLTSPEGQTGANEAVGTFPSAPAAQEALLGETNAYFNDAPVNQLVADSVAAYQPVFFGSLHSAVKQPVEAVLLGMVAGEYSVDEAFEAAVAAGEEAVQLGG